MNVSFEINSRSDAEAAADLILALLGVFKLADGDLVVARPEPEAAPPIDEPDAPTPPPKEKRGRPRTKVEPTSEPTLLETLARPEPSIVEMLTQSPLELNGYSEPAKNIETVRERFRALAIERGVNWLLPVLSARGVKRLSELSDDQVRDLLQNPPPPIETINSLVTAVEQKLP